MTAETLAREEKYKQYEKETQDKHITDFSYDIRENQIRIGYKWNGIQEEKILNIDSIFFSVINGISIGGKIKSISKSNQSMQINNIEGGVIEVPINGSLILRSIVGQRY